MTRVGKLVRIGELNRRIQIQKPVTTTDSEGTESTVWWPAVTVWASIIELQGQRRMEAEAEEFPRTVQVVIRNQPSLLVTAAMRLVYGTRVFEITSVVADQQPPRMLQLATRELHD